MPNGLECAFGELNDYRLSSVGRYSKGGFHKRTFYLTSLSKIENWKEVGLKADPVIVLYESTRKGIHLTAWVNAEADMVSRKYIEKLCMSVVGIKPSRIFGRGELVK